MALTKLPVDSLRANYSFRASLDGTTFVLSFRYNERAGLWIVDIADDQENIIVSGLPILLGTLLTERFSYKNIPIGDLFVLNLEKENEEASRDNLGTNALVLYEEAIL